VIQAYGLFDSPLSLILVYPTLLIPFSTWLLMGYFKTIPFELEECALIDGASRWQILTRIVVPLAIPGLAIALGLLLTYQSFSDFRRSWLFILAGHAIFTLPFMVRSVMAVFAAIDVKTLDEGASSLGASPWRRFRDVIVPNARPGILAGSLMVVTLSLGEFNLTWMLHTPLTKTLPVGLADSYASMRLEVASAYTLVFFVMIIPLLTAMQIFAGTRGGPTGMR